jgi:hypothetical protein
MFHQHKESTMKKLIASIPERLRWHRYWQITRRVQRLPLTIAHRLPRWLARAAYVDVAAYATTRPPLDAREVPGISITEVMETWDDASRERLAERLSAESRGPWVEIGGERMTEAQYNAAVRPFRQPNPGPVV